MSVPEQEIAAWFAKNVERTGKSPREVAAMLCAKYDLTPKPVVDDYDLGVMVNNAFTASHNIASLGGCMQSQLSAAGLTIARIEDAK